MPPYRNLLLSRLPESDLNRLEPYFEPISLPLRTILIHPHAPIDHVTFLESGLGSEIAAVDGKDVIEVGIIGREGLIGLPIILAQMVSPHKVFMQVAGHGHRIAASTLRDVMEESPTLRRILLKYCHDFLIQLAETARANGRSKIQARLARWILMSDDRMDGTSIPLTHEFLGLMLGVRRAGVSEALAMLEGQGLLRSAKANIMITDREGLKAVAKSIYAPNSDLRPSV